MSHTLSIILMVISTIIAAFGQLSLKIGSMKLEKGIKNLIKNYAFMCGVIFYGTATVLTIIALKGGELTVLYPLASLNYVWVSLLSVRYLKEKMNPYKITGIALIIVGVILVL